MTNLAQAPPTKLRAKIQVKAVVNYTNNMQYKKLTSGDIIIEFHNNWLGEETVIVNGQIVSKKSSIWGAHHYFTVMEDGHTVRYVLTTKFDMMTSQVLIDLKKNGQLIHENVRVPYGFKPRTPKNKAKKIGIAKLKEYDLEDAVTELQKALDVNNEDPEIYFHMACAYSILERTEEGFECLKQAVAKGLPDTEIILNHDMLAFLRIHDAFEDFLNSGFKEYEIK